MSSSAKTFKNVSIHIDLPKIELVAPTKEGGSALGLVWFQAEESAKSENKKPKGPRYLGSRNKDIDELAEKLSQSHHFSAKKSEVSVLRYYSILNANCAVLVGAGSSEKFTAEVARQIGASFYKAQKKERLEELTLYTDSLLGSVSTDKQVYYLQAFCEGYLLASYEYTFTKPAPKEAFHPKVLKILGSKNEPWKVSIERAYFLAQAVNFSRLLGDKPPNIMTPSALGEHVQQMARGRALKVNILGKAQLEREKMGCLLGVAQGSVEEPKVIVIEYKGGKKSDKHVALIGKGVTFDSGGISIKPSNGMEDMKYDMMGAATVAAVLQAVADLKLPLNVTGYIGAVENMPSGIAQRPSDVVVSASGKTVEITNTDAEGRLVLADVVTYAQKHHPQAMIDVATLTGAVMVALGTTAVGIMGNSPKLLDQIKKASSTTGEKVWELPLYEEYEEDLKSPYADIRNSGGRNAGSSKGGIFIKFFVDKEIPWAHCDIAGVMSDKADLNYNPAKGAAGFFVRCLTQVLESWEPLT